MLIISWSERLLEYAILSTICPVGSWYLKHPWLRVEYKYLDVNNHPNTCSAIRPFYSVSLSLLSLRTPAWQCKVLDQYSSNLVALVKLNTMLSLVVTHQIPNIAHWQLYTLGFCDAPRMWWAELTLPLSLLPAGLLNREAVSHTPEHAPLSDSWIWSTIRKNKVQLYLCLYLNICIMTLYTKNKQFITWDIISLDLSSWSPQQTDTLQRPKCSQ